MSESNAGSASTQESSGSTETKDQDKVAYETYKRVLSEAKKYKDQLKALEEERNKANEQKLKDQNEWKTLAESKAAEAEKLSSLLKEQEQSIVNGMKYQEFEKHLGGKLKNKDYATFIEFDKIAFNPETKRVDDESVKAVVSQFVKQHSHLVEFGSGKMPNEAASTASFGPKKPEEMSKKELEEFLLKRYSK